MTAAANAQCIYSPYGGYGYGGYGYGGGNGSYSRTVVAPNGYRSSTVANYSAPYASAINTQAALGGTAAIIGAAAPIVMGLINAASQPKVIVQQVPVQQY